MSRWVCKTAVETFLRLCNKGHTFSNPIKLRRRIYGGLKSHNMNLIYLYCRQTTQSESLNISFVLGSKTICITRSKFCLNFVNMMNIFQIYFPPPPPHPAPLMLLSVQSFVYSTCSQRICALIAFI